MITADHPILWIDRTANEKGAILLAWHNGARIERFCEHRQEWVAASLSCGEHHAYRANTDPVRKTIVMVGKAEGFYGEYSFHQCDNVTLGYSHKIMFDLVDGEPDTNSVKMEKL